MHISIVSPVYESESMIDELVGRTLAAVSKLTNDFEIILIDDGSSDKSWGTISRNCLKDRRVKGIKLTRNFGQHYAITAGLDYASGDWVVVMDCDLQDVPEEIEKLYSKAQEGFDIVLAKRISRKDSILKRFLSWMFYKVFNYLSDMNYDYQVGGFRMLSKRVVEQFKLMREKPRYFNSLIEWMGYPVCSISVEHDSRLKGKSTYGFGKLLKHSIDVIIANSEKPLSLSIRLGFVMSFIALIFGVVILLKAIFVGSPVSGWSSLIVSMYFLSGIIISVLGIIGIYLGKTFAMLKNRPLYIVQQIEGFNSKVLAEPIGAIQEKWIKR